MRWASVASTSARTWASRDFSSVTDSGDTRSAMGLRAQVGAQLLAELVDHEVGLVHGAVRVDAQVVDVAPPAVPAALAEARRRRALGLARGARELGAERAHRVVHLGAHLVGEAAHRVGEVVLDAVELAARGRRARRGRHP